MKNKFLLFALSLSVVFSFVTDVFAIQSSPPSPVTIYVSKSGNDATGNRTGSPYKKIQTALNAAFSGDTIRVQGGTYYENLVIPTDGITLEASSNTWLDGVNNVTGKHDNGWKRANSYTGPDEIEVFFENDVYYKEMDTEPEALVLKVGVDCYDIPKLAFPSNDPIPLFEIIDRDEDYSETPDSSSYWDGLEALYMYSEGKTFVRFRDNRDANNLSGGNLDPRIRTSTKPAILIENKNNVVIRNMTIQSGVSGVEIRGANSFDNEIHNCNIFNGRERVLIADGAHHNKIHDCELSMRGMVHCPIYQQNPLFVPGTWQYGTPSNDYTQKVRNSLYMAYKNEIGRATVSHNDDCGIDLAGEGPPYNPAGDGNEIFNNEIFESMSGVTLVESNDTKIHNNEFHHLGSTGVVILKGDCLNTEIYNNTAHNVMHFVRIQNFNYHARELFIYRNMVWNPIEMGSTFVMGHGQGIANPKAKLYIYHNSVSGSTVSIRLPKTIYDATGSEIDNRVFVVNNVISSYIPVKKHVNYLAQFQNNWVGGPAITGRQSFISDTANNNIDASEFVDKYMWDWSGLEFTAIPQDSFFEPAEPNPSLPENGNGVGLDLRITQIDERFMPGIGPNYYIGAPDIGAIERPDQP